ncbi:hypothetical protein AB0M95_26390 [Sphaerisporangium sp. NPDC051017]|uniref:hypothetical protein n=1 Tax=Sphaerisporangium sp. NPDC051017 TaxID=3154636 RepID=UPI00342D7DCC
MVYAQDDDGDECRHVFRVDLDDPQTPAVDLTPLPKVVVHYGLLDDDPAPALITGAGRTCSTCTG